MDARLAAGASRATHQIAAWVPLVARIGYAAKGVVYLLVGYIAARAALAAGSPTGATGALEELLENGGRWIVLLVAVGLAAHLAWRLVQALLDPEHPGGSRRLGARVFYLVSGAIYGSLALTAFRLARGRDADASGNEEHFAATLMSQPFGPWLVGAVGVGIVGYGLHQLVVAARGDVARHLRIPEARRKIVLALGRLGTAARGIVLGIVGTFFVDAARQYDPREAGGADEALRWLGHGWLLMAVAVGLIAYGLFQLAKARYRHIDVPR